MAISVSPQRERLLRYARNDVAKHSPVNELKESMKVLLVNVGYPPFLGGSQLYTQWLAERLTADGHTVAVHTTDAAEVESIWDARKSRLPCGREWQNGVVLYRHALRHLPLSPYSYYLLRRGMVALSSLPLVPSALLSALARYAPWVPQLANSLATVQEPPDVVHAFTIPFESLILAAGGAARRWGVPFIITPFLHTGEPGDGAVAAGYAMPHQLALLRCADAVVTLTAIERGFLLRAGVGEHRVRTIPAGIPVDQLAGGKADRVLQERGLTQPLVLFLGAVTYEKGAIHLVEAMRRLWRGGSDASLAIAGNVVDHFRSYYAALPGEDKARCHLLGRISEEEKRDLLDACTLLALPSRVDSFGLVYLEGWAYGKPVIGARAGGTPAVIDDGEDGYLVPFGDVETLGQRIAFLLEHREVAQELGQRGRQKVMAHYTWERVYQQMIGLYGEVLGYDLS